MSEADFPFVLPTEPGLYHAAKFPGLTTIRVNEDGSAETIVERDGRTWVHAILDFRHYADEFGPFKRIDVKPGPRNDV